MNRPFDIRDPPFKFRQFIVSIVFAVFGGFGGLTFAIVFGHAVLCTIVGAVAGAVLGAKIEANGS